MAHFAKLNEHNEVLKVYVIGNDVADTEQNGINECIRLHGEGIYKQCSYNTQSGIHYDFNQHPRVESADQSKAFRKNYPSKGWLYNPDIDGFTPRKPYPSWVLNETKGDWEAPVPYPTEYLDHSGLDYPRFWAWDEENQRWVESNTPELIK